MNRVVAKCHAYQISGHKEGWIPPPACLIGEIVIPVQIDPLPRRNCGFDDNNVLCYRVMSSRWWQYWHWRFKSGGWLHCRAKYAYEPNIKYAQTTDGEYQERSVRWYEDFTQALVASIK